MNIHGSLKKANFKKLTLCGLLVASLFAASINATKMAYTAGGVLMTCVALNRFIATIRNAITAVDAVQKWGKLDKRQLSMQMRAKEQAGYQLMFYLNIAGFVVNGLTTAAATYISYLCLKERFASHEATQKDPEAQIDEWVRSLPEDKQAQFHKEEEDLKQKMSSVSDEEI